MIVRLTRLVLMVVALGAVNAFPAAAQGVQTGTLRGQVLTADGQPASGAAVTISSPALQGVREARMDANGVYAFRGLPPGTYTVTVRAGGAEVAQRETHVPLDGTAVVDVRLQIGNLSARTDVIAPPLADPGTRFNLRRDDVDALAHPRTLAGIVRLAPGVIDAGPTAGPTEGQAHLVINGSFAYDNVFMLNGVDVTDNIFGWPQNLFIEDAIAETQALTTGIPAEYGRFGGGVVSAITRSGGNIFSGSYRANLANRAWSTETPFERSRDTTRRSQTNTVHEGTLGGPIARDRLWFFVAGRYANVEISPTLPATGLVYETSDRNRRGEVKVTGTVAAGHTVQASALGNPRTQTDQANLSITIDRFALSDKERPNHLLGVRYTGVSSARLLLEAQYSHEQFQTDAGGGMSTAIADSPFLTPDFQQQYNAPYFDATDPDERNNRQLTGNASYFAGSHDVKAGYEWFRSNKVGGNSQSSTGYVFFSDYLTEEIADPVTGGTLVVPALDGEGRVQPLFLPGDTFVTRYVATRGAALDIDHHSAFVQDRWAIGRRLTANLGLRLEHVSSQATATPTGVSATRALPRLGLSFDPTARGSYVVHGTYSHYSARYSDALFLRNSPVGSPSEVYGTYVGPPGEGRGFAPGFDVANYDFDSGFFPTANVRFDDDLSSPLVREATASVAAGLTSRGSIEATYVWRQTRDIVEDFISIANGVTQVTESGVDLVSTNVVYANTDAARRDYQALLFQGRYEVTPALTLQGNWTVQLENEGNYEGELPNQIVTSQIGDWPEIFTEARHYPSGRLPSFQRHRVNIWGTYAMDFGRGGRAVASGLWRINSARTYTLRTAAGPTPSQLNALAAAGYPDFPFPQTVYFSPLGSEEFRGYGVVDTAVTYDIPLMRALRPWLKVELYNLFDNQKLIRWNTSVRPDPDTPTDSLGLRTGYLEGSQFGQAVGETSFPVPFQGATGGRTLRLALGVRF
jgi:hypothetical protein